MKLTIHAFYVAKQLYVTLNIIRQLCYNEIQITINRITGFTCLFHIVHCPQVFKKANNC